MENGWFVLVAKNPKKCKPKKVKNKIVKPRANPFNDGDAKP
jgi:hypothetical protein